MELQYLTLSQAKLMTQTTHNYFLADHYQDAVTITCVPLLCCLVSSMSSKCASNDLLFIALATVWPVRLIYNPGATLVLLPTHKWMEIYVLTLWPASCASKECNAVCVACAQSLLKCCNRRRLQSQSKHAWHTLIGVISWVYLGVLPAGTRRFHQSLLWLLQATKLEKPRAWASHLVYRDRIC